MAKISTASTPEPPKKALTAFFLYRQEVYEDVKRDNPDSRITQITKIIGEMWNNADQETKSRLEKEYQKNKAKAAKEKELYEQKFGKIQGPKRKTSKKSGKGKK